MYGQPGVLLWLEFSAAEGVILMKGARARYHEWFCISYKTLEHLEPAGLSASQSHWAFLGGIQGKRMECRWIFIRPI